LKSDRPSHYAESGVVEDAVANLPGVKRGTIRYYTTWRNVLARLKDKTVRWSAARNVPTNA